METIQQNYNRKLFWQFEKFQTNLKANFGTQIKQSSFTIRYYFIRIAQSLRRIVHL